MAEKCGIMVSCFISLQPELHAVVVVAVEGCALCRLQYVVFGMAASILYITYILVLLQKKLDKRGSPMRVIPKEKNFSYKGRGR